MTIIHQGKKKRKTFKAFWSIKRKNILVLMRNQVKKKKNINIIIKDIKDIKFNIKKERKKKIKIKRQRLFF